MTVNELMTAYPSGIIVFFKRKMLCIECPTETFHTLEDVARVNGIALENFTKELGEAIEA
jgi:hybrid cluster-associated redox disulfide protein